jgi:hypothetical protein
MVSMQTLSDEAFLAHFNLEEVTMLLEQGEVSAAKEALLAHYESRVMSTWPLPPSSIPDLYIDTTKLSQE